ncbi:hypothetical protein JS561_05145 [Salmonella enterica subsp. enterica serovar Infantis]|nr:hypothetical protein JS561_05145 [Salmonella enterica subsp. enterica serovar Infantis]
MKSLTTKACTSTKNAPATQINSSRANTPADAIIRASPRATPTAGKRTAAAPRRAPGTARGRIQAS